MATMKGSIKSDRLNANLSTKKVTVSIGGGGTITTSDHSQLTNLDFEHSGHTGFAGILMNTTAYWNSHADYRPPLGMLIVYTDYQSYIDEHGQTVNVPGFKIGDGNAYLIDNPFVGEAESKALLEHIENQDIHIRPGERARWDNKLNYNEPAGDLLEFTRD